MCRMKYKSDQRLAIDKIAKNVKIDPQSETLKNG